MESSVRATGRTIDPRDWRKVLPFKTVASIDGLGWVGLQAARCREEPAFELSVPALNHHRLVFVARPSDELELRFDGVKRNAPSPAGSITLVPAGSLCWARSSGHKDELHIFLDAGLVARVAAEAFDLDPARLTVPPLDGLRLPHLRAAIAAVDAELSAGGAGGPLASESLANVLAVHLIRHVSAPSQPTRRQEAALSRAKLRAVIEYIEEHLDGGLTLQQMAAVAHLSAYHFARQFKLATGQPPHQYVIARRVERAQQLLRQDRDLSLAEIAACVGFSDQSQFSHHFKRVIGVTPGRFRTSKSARIA
jgi:AraC family transcriptional regulator